MSNEMSDQLRAQATTAVLEWIKEVHGQEIANHWAWSCTCYPFGLPDDGMLEDGLSLALREVTIGYLVCKVEEEMNSIMKREKEAGT